MYPRTEDSTKTRLRIRPKNTTVRQLNLSLEQINEAQKVMSSPASRQMRHVKLKQILKGNSCCVCDHLPSVEIVYHLGGVSKIERYCDICIKTVYQRERNEPQQSKEQEAAKYGCVIGNIHDTVPQVIME